MAEWTIEKLYEQGILSELNYRFARFIGRLDGRHVPGVSLAAAMVSRRRAEGHICVDLAGLKDGNLRPSEAQTVTWPTLVQWMEILEPSPAVGRPGDFKPLILDGPRLYLYRYWNYEKKLAETLRAMAAEKEEAFDEGLLRALLADLFPSTADRKDDFFDRQKLAAFSALRNRLCIISGGPGTGKTFTVAKILALLIQQNSHRDFRISLAAPTGKAAARLQESVKAAKSVLNCPDAVKKRIPEEASTLHRLLGAIPRSPYFRHDDQHRLTADCVVIDEASMVDLALFAKLVEALKADARLILLGDKDQLASVEAGAILGDICDAGRTHGYSTSLIDAYCRVTGEVAAPADLQDGVQGISDGIVELTKSYRFDETGGIGALSRAVNAGNAARALAVTQEGKDRDLDWKDLPPPDRLTSALEAWAVERFRGYLSTSDPGAALERQGRARILCALREGPYGVTHINAVVEKILIKNGLIGRAGKWYHGRPVMITKNDYSLGLYNGDMGIAMKDGDQGNALKVFFPGKDGPPRRFAPMALPEHETVYALTVHKSQGSEYDDVLFILSDWDAPILTRELIYTAVTRACRRIEIWGKKEIFLAAVNRRIQRSSGLRQSLWNMAAP